MRIRLLICSAALPLALCAALPLQSDGASPRSRLDDIQTKIKSTQGRIGKRKGTERVLTTQISAYSARIGALEARIGRLERRQAAVQADLDRKRAELGRLQAELRSERRRLVRLRRRLAVGRATLAAQLVNAYKADPPDPVSLVLGSDSFAQLIETMEFMRRVNDRNAEVVDRVRAARAETAREAAVLARLEVRRSDAAEAIGRRRDALASMRDGLAERQATLTRARAARAWALAGTRAGRTAAERALRRLIAERRRAAARAARSGGPWAIPWPIVQCESGGQNLPPNGAGASGYYQMLPETWKGLGGSTRHAYQASKAEQDRLAARLWAGGSGAHNWVCAS
jgi:septal ring factor EnvC (AmiA/AmiB activator)